VPAPNLAPPPLSASATNLNITRLVRLASGNVVIEFPTTTNRTYTVVYSDGDATFANAKMAVPPFSAPANYAEWIDYGPPGTASAPTNVSARFYRVLQFP
jgi:hypothetical protein